MIMVNETKMLQMLENSTKVLLVEPKYLRKYPPLGLAKIKTFLEQRNIKNYYARSVIPDTFDLICVTSLFTYYSKHVFDVLNDRGLFNQNTKILVGGVFASLMPEQFKKFKNVYVFKGYSKILDQCIPHKDLMNTVDDPWDTFSYVFTSRGCVNRCKYCSVWRIEKERWINDKWKDHIDHNRPNIMISDNNLSAVTFEHITEVINFVVKSKKKVLFDNGFDCKYITEEMAEQLARVKYVRSGMRLAFDRIEEDGIFQKAVKMLKKAGIPANAIMAYVLFNFTDRPQDADYRTRECANLGIRPYPQYYRPLDTLDKSTQWIGKHCLAYARN